ncbi:hypothetical protein [Methylobacterium radiotolerans]|uniref:hypothetical protein n=1 Tax=Methylobacterium radiotolerans TaxID=31998 RepID=UPI001403311F|nr:MULTISPECIES: hypothetical protein [Methylobacterium]
MRLFRQHLSVGQHFRSEDGTVDGVIVAIWPTDRGSEAIVKSHGNGTEIRVFVPSKPTAI